jgi:hypothetical protein
MTNNIMNDYFIAGFLKRAEQYGIDANTAISMHEKYAGPIEDFKAMESPGLQVVTPTAIPVASPGTLSTGSAGAAGKPVLRGATKLSPGAVSTGTAKATPGLRSGAEGMQGGLDNLKNFFGFGK